MNSAFSSSGRLKILVLGYIVRGPMGGMTWHHLQYLQGLNALGHEVYYMEDSGDSAYCCYDPVRGIVDQNPEYGLQYGARIFDRAGFGSSWCYYDHHTGNWHGPLSASVMTILRDCDIVINLSGTNAIRPWLERIPVRILIDTDPVFTQVKNLTDSEALLSAKKHTAFFTFAENIGENDCTIPDDGITWVPTRQPVFMEAWPIVPGQDKAKFTTVMQWESYMPQSYQGRVFGLKSHSFPAFLHLPELCSEKFELALGGTSAPRDELRRRGWELTDPLQIAENPWSYQHYLQQSKAEFSVAKQAYVEVKTGWFSERSAVYLASGRPVIVQDTGFTRKMDSGRGILPFRDILEAKAAIEMVSGDYGRQCRWAREMAFDCFESGVVLSHLLEKVG
jgi:hypothetical protein